MMDEDMTLESTETPIPFMQVEVGAYLRSAIKNWEQYRDWYTEHQDAPENAAEIDRAEGAIEALQAVQEALFGEVADEVAAL